MILESKTVILGKKYRNKDNNFGTEGVIFIRDFNVDIYIECAPSMLKFERDFIIMGLVFKSPQ